MEQDLPWKFSEMLTNPLRRLLDNSQTSSSIHPHNSTRGKVALTAVVLCTIIALGLRVVWAGAGLFSTAVIGLVVLAVIGVIGTANGFPRREE